MYKVPDSRYVDAWFEYCTTNTPSAEIARAHGVHIATLYTRWSRSGLVQRRKQYRPRAVDHTSPKDTCPGWSVFCGECPVKVSCTDWACMGCKVPCACKDPGLKPKNWTELFAEWRSMKERNGRALDTFAYAWDALSLMGGIDE